jgi:hypothetical protein
MNKDLDARLLANGEYRDALNVQISRSEGEDVGALENVLGNILLVDINDSVGATIKNLEIIGYFMNTTNNTIYFMLTNYNDTSADQLSNFATSGSSHYIYSYNITTGTAVQLVTGSFLNFSKTHPIYGINVLEELLFWTDDRNQPRKINITSATNNPATSSTPYYTTEDQISVAKYYPYNPLRLYIENSSSTSTTGTGSTTLVISTPNLDIRVGDVVTSNSSTVQTQTVYVTAINVTKTNITLSSGLTWVGTNIFTFRRSAMEDVVSEHLPKNPSTDPSDNPSYWPSNHDSNEWPGDATFLEDKFVRFSYRYKFDDGEYSIIAPFTQPAFIPKQDGYFMTDPEFRTEDSDIKKTYVSTIVDFMENKVNNIELQLDTPGIVGHLFKDYKITHIDILYKESDQTSIKLLESIPYTADSIAGNTGDITGIELIDGGAGYTGNGNNTTTTNGTGFGMTINYASTDPGPITSGVIVNEGSGYSNGDQVFPSGGDGTAYFTVSVINGTTFVYDYQSRKPITTLPADQSTRVYDKVPVRAFAQEVAGNRVIYGNYINKHTSPSSLSYGVNVSDRLESFEANTSFSTVAYPTHSLKQNRNYQVGIVLADRFGRQSDVVLSSVDTAIVDTGRGSTVKSSYRTAAQNLSKNVLNWNGDSLKVIFNTVIPSAISTPGYPGLYSATNPLGWYTYKIVVKQQQQEYYNVYLPGILNGYPYNTTERNQTAFTSLYSDNINKIPKDLNAVGPEQVQFNSDVDMWGRVSNTWLTPLPFAPTNKVNYAAVQYYPETLSDRSLIVGTMQDLDVGTTQILNALTANERTSTTEFYITKYDTRIVPGMSVESIQIKAGITALGTTIGVYDQNLNTGYTPGTTTTSIVNAGGNLTCSRSTASALILDITVNADGEIETIVVNTNGAGLEVGDFLSWTGGGVSGVVNLIVEPVTVVSNVESQFSEPTPTATGISNAKATLTLSHATTTTTPISEMFTFNYVEKDIFYNENSNPYIARISTRKEIGTINTIMSPQLAVYETAPVFSNIPIYWETSTSGLISELNTLITSENVNNPTGLRLSSNINNPIVYSQNENMAVGADVTDDFKVINGTPAFINSDIVVTLASVTDLNGADRTSDFNLVSGAAAASYKIQTNTLFAFLNDIGSRSFVFNLNVNVSGANKSSTNFTVNGSLSNTAPTATASPVSPVVITLTSPPLLTQHYVTTVTAFNGSASTGTLREDDITFTVRDNTEALTTDFFLVPTSNNTVDVYLKWPTGPGSGVYDIIIRARDGGASNIDLPFKVTVT